jgi:hypothetical protein
MKKIIVFALSGIILYSCSNTTPKTETTSSDSKLNQIENTNDMEYAAAIIPSWSNEKTVVAMKEPPAHSGKYACVTNDTLEYSYTYAEQFKNINTGLPNRVDVSGWIYSTIARPNIAIILDVSENEKPYDWMAFPLADSVTISGRWVEFNSSFYFSKPLNPEQVIKIFAWNQAKKPIYIDDLKFRFEY